MADPLPGVGASVPLAPGSKPDPELRKLQEATGQFEAYFLSLMMKEMRKSVPQGGLLGNGLGQDIYQSMFDDALGSAMAQRGGIGLSKAMLGQYIRQHPQKSPQDSTGIDRSSQHESLPTGGGS